jgi:Flp pilus assembly protein TadD
MVKRRNTKRFSAFLRVSVVIITLAAAAAFAQEKQEQEILPRWKWSKGDTFRYRLQGDVVAPNSAAERNLVSSVITISAKDGRLASFTNTYTEIRQREKEVWYCATKEELEKLSVSFVMDTAGRVTGDDKKLVKQQQGFLDALMVLPPKKVSVGSFWPLDLPGAELYGVCEFTGYGKRSDRKCAIFKMELASREKVGKEPVRMLKATLYFDVGECCFVHVERRIETRGEEPRDEILTIDLVSSPKQRSAVEKEQIIIENLKRRLKRHPKDTSIMRRLADNYARLGKLQDALSMINAILQHKPGDVKTLTRKGELLLAAGDAKASLEHFKKAVQLEKDSSRALLGAARASFTLQKYDSSARYARLALDEDKKGPYQAYHSLGTALAKLGRKNEAQKALERYIELNPNIDKTKKPIIAFTKDNDVSLVVRRTTPVNIEKRLKYTPRELAEGRELIRALIKEESVRLRLAPEQVVELLEYIAGIYGRKPPEMIADFLADREKTYEKVKAALQKELKLPREKIAKLAASDDLDPARMEALLSMLEPRVALKRLEALFETRANVARYQYLLGRYYMTNPKEFGKKALKRFEYAIMFDKTNALYHYALALVCSKLPGQQEKMLDELATKNMSLKKLEASRVAVAKERLRVLTELKFNKRIRKVTAWTLDDQSEARIVKELLDIVIRVAQKNLKGDFYSVSAMLAELAYYMTLDLEKNAASALMLTTARSARETALGVLVQVCAGAAADQDEPDRKKYARELPSWRAKLAKVEDENFIYLHAYVEFLKRCEQAFQVEPYTDHKKADRFIDKLFENEIGVLMKEVEKQRKEWEEPEGEISKGGKGKKGAEKK